MLLTVALSLTLAQASGIEKEAGAHPNAATYRSLADRYVAAGEYAKASEAFARASILYRKLGDPNAAKVLSGFADRYRTTIGVYYDRPVEDSPADSLAKFEPVTGCYLGANIEREDETRDPGTFNERIGKHHAMFFMYRKYGVPFPTEYARTVRRAGSALQLAFEPRDLREVRDDSYLRRFAEDARRSGIPIFLRYASEMNGSWTPYHGDPALYIEKFRLVARVMHENAPNVAMVWCPNEIPEEPIPRYFPGDGYVDWVGVNFYSVIFNDANRARNAEWKHPEDALSFVYRTYAARHPIMVGEWAASHESAVDNRPRPDFATTKIAQFYAAIPRLYPRVKAVSWLSFNTFKYAGADRQLNNYSLFDNRQVAEVYSRAVSDPYYLPVVEPRVAPDQPSPVTDGLRFGSSDRLSVLVRSYENAPSVTVRLDQRVLGRGTGVDAVDFRLPASISSGYHTLKVEVRDSRGKLAGTRSMPIFLRGS